MTAVPFPYACRADQRQATPAQIASSQYFPQPLRAGFGQPTFSRVFPLRSTKQIASSGGEAETDIGVLVVDA
jgi:uncharacterized protein YcgL (UPF0745 family)